MPMASVQWQTGSTASHQQRAGARPPAIGSQDCGSEPFGSGECRACSVKAALTAGATFCSWASAPVAVGPNVPDVTSAPVDFPVISVYVGNQSGPFWARLEPWWWRPVSGLHAKGRFGLWWPRSDSVFVVTDLMNWCVWMQHGPRAIWGKTPLPNFAGQAQAPVPRFTALRSHPSQVAA